MLASGSGTLLEALIVDGLPVAVVVADRPCRAIEVARAHGLSAALVTRQSYGRGFDRMAYTVRVVEALRASGADLVAMAGFGTVLEEPLHSAFPRRVLNTHPALLPSFRGWHAVAAALEAGVKVTGCTVHLATLEVDAGPILAQEAVRVLPGDTVDTLHERIKVVERRLYPATIRSYMAELEVRVG